jgi:pimeloyl-ACP methyl ester carboxylesterase
MVDRLPPGVQVTAVGHSNGTPAVLKAAQARPYRFKNLIVEEPVGFGHRQGRFEQVFRVGKKIVLNQWRALFGQGQDERPSPGYTASPDKESPPAYSWRVGRAQFAAGPLLARNPIVSLQEASAAGGYDATADLELVSKLGIPVHVVGAHGDELFDRSELTEAIMPEGKEFLAPISYAANRQAGHDTVWMQPKLHAHIIGCVVGPWVAKSLR